MQLTQSQNIALNKLINAFNNRTKCKIASFKAPTGAGKTFIASEFISRVFANEIDNKKKTIFVVATISNASLPKQFARKLNEYKKFHEFQNYKIEFIQSPSISKNKKTKTEDIKEFNLEDNKVFVFGIASFGKNTLFYQNRTLDIFLQQANALNYQIFFIRDEAHIIGKKERIGVNERKNFDQKMNESSNFVLHMTATPKYRENLIVMTSKDMQSDGLYLLKNKIEKSKLIGEVSNEEIIDDALKIFKETKKEYRKLDVIINPALLIQIMNESDYAIDKIKNKEFHDGLALLEKKLKEHGLKYLKYLGNSPEVIGTNVPNTLEYASEIDSEIDAIIFKVGPATGWDIPRANMLLQLRNVSSESLNVQTIGRIRRNPYTGLKLNEITNKYYVWSNYQEPSRDEATYNLKDKYINESFISGRIDKNNKKIIYSNENYRKDVISFINSEEFINKLNDIDPLNDVIYNKIDYSNNCVVKDKINNHIFLQIYILKKKTKMENTLKYSLFDSTLNKIAKCKNVHINIVWYVFLNFEEKLFNLMHKNSKWIQYSEPYILNDVKTLENYTIWKDNKDAKYVKTSDFKNYGYIQVTGESDIQFLDSTPEMQFYKIFRNSLSTSQKEKIRFFAKMPTLRSQVYFEYYSKIKGKITPSYMDFAIKYNDKIIMIEVKSEDQDYNEEKTKELLNAYKKYMENMWKFKNKNLSLVLYQYNKKNDKNYINAFIHGKWVKNENDKSFKSFFNELFK